jgi:hypothetical protein
MRLVDVKQMLESPGTRFEAARKALQFVSAEHGRVYSGAHVDWAAELTAEFDDFAARRPHETDACRQFVEYLDMKDILLLSHERDLLAIDRMVSRRY